MIQGGVASASGAAGSVRGCRPPLQPELASWNVNYAYMACRRHDDGCRRPVGGDSVLKTALVVDVI